MKQEAPLSSASAMPLLLPDSDHPAKGEAAKSSLVGSFVPYRNLRALIGYYCAIFGLVPIAGFILGPVALLFGIAGVTYAQSRPQHRGLYHALFAVVLGTAEFVAHLTIPLTLFIFLPQGVLHDLFPFIPDKP